MTVISDVYFNVKVKLVTSDNKSFLQSVCIFLVPLRAKRVGEFISPLLNLLFERTLLLLLCFCYPGFFWVTYVKGVKSVITWGLFIWLCFNRNLSIYEKIFKNLVQINKLIFALKNVWLKKNYVGNWQTLFFKWWHTLA